MKLIFQFSHTQYLLLRKNIEHFLCFNCGFHDFCWISYKSWNMNYAIAIDNLHFVSIFKSKLKRRSGPPSTPRGRRIAPTRVTRSAHHGVDSVSLSGSILWALASYSCPHRHSMGYNSGTDPQAIWPPSTPTAGDVLSREPQTRRIRRPLTLQQRVSSNLTGKPKAQ